MNSDSIGIKVLVTDSAGAGKSATEAAKTVEQGAARTKKHTNEISGDINKIMKAVNKVINTAGLIAWVKVIKGAMEQMLKASEKQSEYVENLNMMDVAFGKTAKSAEKYVQSLTNAIGVDQSGITRQLGIFRQISSAMQYTSEVADLLSTNLSKLSLDISSLYNVSYERAGKALESAITGQVRSIRSLTGADITLATLQQEAYRLGIEKTTREMTRAEKTILIYLSLERQLANANGDMARTVNSVANQTKIFKDQITMLGRQLGGFFIPILKTILPLLNGILMVLNAIVKTILTLFGIDASSLASEFGIMDSGLEMLEDGLEGVGAAAKEAKKQLRGFDKLNNLTTPNSSGSGTGIGGLNSAIDEKLLSYLKEYNLQLDKMRNKATEIRDRILSWLGFTIDANGELKWTGNLLNGILDVLLLIVGTASLIKGVVKIVKALTGVLGLANAAAVPLLTLTFPQIIAISALVVAAIGGIIGVMKILNEYSEKNTDKLRSVSEETQKRLQPVQEAFENLKDTIGDISYDGLAITQEETDRIVESVDNLIESLKAAYKDYIDEQIRNTNELYYTLGVIDEEEYNRRIEKLTKSLNEQYAEYDKYGEELKEKSAELYDENGNIIGTAYAEYLKMLQEYEDEQYKLMASSEKDIETLVKEANLKNKNERKKYYSAVLQEAAKNRDDEIKIAGEKYNKLLKTLKDNNELTADEYAKEKEKLDNWYDTLVDKANDSYNNLYDGLSSTVYGMEDVIDRGTGKIKGFWRMVADDAKSSIFGMKDAINGLFSGIGKVANTHIGNDINLLFKSIFKADGGFVNSGDIFVANENNKPEYIGSFGNQTAVANTDQIVDGIAIGVTKAMVATGANKESKVVIDAKGDASGLLDFITFEQRKKDRQYGL